MKYSDLTQIEKNKLVIQYEVLVCKLTKQFFSKNCGAWEDLKSLAYEGLALAIEKYDDERSEMTFTQYAAFAIRNNILNGLNNETRTVKMTAYMQSKAKETGDAVFNTISIDRNIRSNDEKKPLEIKLNMYSNETFSDGDVFEYMHARLIERFKDRDIKMFYKTFGLMGEDEMKGIDIAKEFSVSGAVVSNKVHRIVSWIKTDTDLCEVLSNLLEK